MNSILIDDANYNLMKYDIGKALGPEAETVFELLSMGYSKLKISKIMKCPYPRVRDLLAKIKNYVRRIYAKEQAGDPRTTGSGKRPHSKRVQR